mmetsp:Transcript_7735/g.11070  ORF Transcript_7735/g.11070 Transcript_7735/m.11070 type:complete len:513 (-) Transcript_7735:294-1832(-)
MTSKAATNNAQVTIPSNMEVDYDKNLTTLYEAITNCDWDLAIATAKSHPEEAQTWVVRHYNDDDDDDDNNKKDIMWRFLPIHSACARQPPASVLSALLKAYPDGAKCVDDQGMYPLHYACGNQASREIIRLLLVAFPQATNEADPRGMLPLHYLACWGPSIPSIIDMVMVANRSAIHEQDDDNNTPLDLAMDGEYELRDEVIMALQRWLKTSASSSSSINSKEEESRNFTTKPTTTTTTTPGVVLHEEKSDKDLTITAATTTPAPSLGVDTTIPSSGGTGMVVGGAAGIMESPRTVQRLRYEVTKLKADKRDYEIQSKRDLDRTVARFEQECTELTDKLESTHTELDQCHDRIAELQDKVKDQDTQIQQYKLMETQHATLQQDHEQLQQKYNALQNQTTSVTQTTMSTLQSTLERLIATQRHIMETHQDKYERLISGAELRRTKLQSLLDFEHQFLKVYAQQQAQQEHPNDEGNVSTTATTSELYELQQQLKEMELLQANIQKQMSSDTSTN